MRWMNSLVSIAALLVPAAATCQSLALRADGVEFPDGTVQTTAAVDTLAGLSCGADQVAKWSGSAWVCADDLSSAYIRTVVVSPVGTPAQNGTALLAAMAAIPTPASQADAWLLKLEPGKYDVGATPLTMKQWVDVEGSGEGVTTVTGAACGPFTGVVIGAEDTELRMLSVENTCSTPGQYSQALYSDADGTRLRRLNLTLGVSGVQTHGIWVTGSGVLIEDVVVTITEGTTAYGVHSTGESLTLTGARANVSCTDQCVGIYITGDASSARHLTATATGGSSSNIGFEFYSVIDGILKDAVASASGTESWAIVLDHSSVTAADVIASGDDRGVSIFSSSAKTVRLSNVTAESSTYGLYTFRTGGTLTVEANHCRISGAAASVYNYADAATVKIGVSQLGGGAVSGVATCALVYDEGYSYYLNTCP